jgi:hypothetical protein
MAPIALIAARRQGHDVQVVFDEADAASAILRKQVAGQPIPNSFWQRLTSSEGYQRLSERERAMHRAFTDAEFRAFLLSDTLKARAPELLRTTLAWRAADLTPAMTRAASYLPAGTPIRARLYPVIKPKTNSFVFQQDSIPGIFIYINPEKSAADLENRVAHELHHIGYSAACPGSVDSNETPAMQTLGTYLHGFGEGLAMLAAAGGPDINAHETSDAASRARWNRDIDSVATGFRAIEGWIREVLDGRITSPDSVRTRAFEFYGEQGPWYTVGWVMASTIERAEGRARLIEVMCRPRDLMREYNLVAQRAGNGPRWTDDVLARLLR